MEPEQGGALSVLNIEGQNFSPLALDNVVVIGGIRSGVLGASKERLNLRVPVQVAPGLADVLVISGGRVSNSRQFRVLGSRQTGISRVIPPAGPWGSLLALDGAYLLGSAASSAEGYREDAAPTVSFPAQGGGTANAPVISFSPDRLIVQVPPNAASGNITLNTPDGQSSAIPFQVNSDPFSRPLPAAAGIPSLLNPVKKPVDLAIDPATQLAFVAMSGIARVEAFAVTDVVDTTPVANAAVGLQPARIALDLGRRLGFVTNSISNTVSVFRLPDAPPPPQSGQGGLREAALTVLRTLPAGKNPLGVAVDSASGLLAVANNIGNTVSLYNLDTFAAVATLPAYQNPVSVTFDNRRHRLYVSNAGSDFVQVFDTLTLQGLDPLKVGPGQGELVFDPLTEKLAVAAADSNLVYIVNPESGEVKTAGVGARPQDLAVNSARHSLLVLNLASQSLSEVDMATAEVVSEVPLAASPVALDYDIVNNRGLIINTTAAAAPAGAGLIEQQGVAGFSVIRMPAQLNFPRLLSYSRGEEIGIALANLSTRQASLVITALTNDGQRLEGPGLANPKSLAIDSGSQQALLPQELFGAAIPSDGWVKVQTDAADLKGFFLSFDRGVRYLDGAVENGELVQKALLPAILAGSGAVTELTLVNENPIPAGAALTLMGKDGFQAGRLNLTIPAFGALQRNVQDLLPEADADQYLLLDSILPLRIYEQFGGGADIAALNAIRIADAGDELVFPQFAAGGDYYTQVSMINLESEPQLITIAALDDNGSLIMRLGALNPQSYRLPGKGKLVLDLATNMGLGGGTVQQGSIRVASAPGSRIAGFVSYGTTRALVSVAAQSQPRSAMVFSHVAETEGDGQNYFTGVALLNPNSVAAGVQVVVHRPDGVVAGAWSGNLPPGGRVSKLLRELPGIGNSILGLTGGYFRVMATEPIYGLSIFGTGDLSALAAIPPQ